MPALTLSLDFAVTPRFEVFYALYTLRNPSPTRLDEWKERALLRLPGDFDKAARRVAPVPLFWPLLADSLQGAGGELSFEEMITHLRGVDASELRNNVLSGIFHDARTVDILASRSKSLRDVLADRKLPGAQLLAQFGMRPEASNTDAVRTLERLVADTESFRGELVRVLEIFWQSGFKADWSALEPKLREHAQALRKSYGQSPDNLAVDLKLPFSIDPKTRAIKTRSGEVIPLRQVERFTVLPSAFNTHRWWAKYNAGPSKVLIYVPTADVSVSANAITRESRRSDQPVSAANAIHAEAVFRALGDTTRYAIASVLARTPTTSAELARTLKVSKPTITHHVQALRAAGLISQASDYGASKLSLNAATVRGLSAAAVDQLFASTGDLPLETTRKRRS